MRVGLDGWDDQPDPLLLPHTALVKAENIEYIQGGGIKKRGGMVKYNTTAVTYLSGTVTASVVPTDLYHWNYVTDATNVDKRILIAVTGGIFKEDSDYVWDQIGTSGSNIIAATCAPGTDSNSALVLVIGREDIYRTAQSLVKYARDTGTTTALGGSPPSCSVVEMHGARLHMAGNQVAGGNTRRVYWSGANNVEDWDEVNGDAGHIDITGYGPIRALKSFQGNLIIFTENSVQMLEQYAPDDYIRRIITTQVGCTSPRLIADVGNDIIFVSRYGVVSLKTLREYGLHQDVFLSDPIRNYFRDTLDKTWMSVWKLVYHGAKDQLWLSSPVVGTASSSIFVCHLSEKDSQGRPKWSRWPLSFGVYALAPSIATDGTNKPVMLGGGYGTGFDGFVFTMDSATLSDNGTAYTSTVKTPWLTGLNIEGIRPDKHYRFSRLKTWLANKAGVVTATHWTYGGTTTTSEGTTSFEPAGSDGAPYYAAVDLSMTNVAQGLQLQFEQSASNKDMQLLAFGVDLEEEGEAP